MKIYSTKIQIKRKKVKDTDGRTKYRNLVMSTKSINSKSLKTRDKKEGHVHRSCVVGD